MKAGVPVNISKLLLPDNGLCAVKSSNATQPQKSMCSFVKTLTKDYVNAKSAGKGRDKSTAYVYEAIGRLGVGNSLLDFNCSLWTNITEKAANILVNQEESKAVPEPQKVPVPQNLSTTVKSVSGFFTNDTVSCEEECRGAWKAVCGVTAALLDVLPKKPVTPTVGAPGKISVHALCVYFLGHITFMDAQLEHLETSMSHAGGLILVDQKCCSLEKVWCRS